ncbi:hypothetical protein [Neoactinobaculum massilliense]|mgnify:CR=1 FL=1|uniref:hypothetical protein n=1 Tax=Neoactinobaculum massilliense TaxID=2364794 RepID=UPI000F549C4F|nr:hypothetical protein [Neoactinobaculum massilliense]
MKKVIVGALAAMFLAVTAPASAFAVVEQSVTPNQDEHRSTFVNDEHCDPAVDGHRHPFEQWVTDEWDRYNGTSSFTNRTDRPIRYTLEVTEGVNESVKASTTSNAWDVFFKGLTGRYGIVEESEWRVGDTLGPVTVKPGQTMRADYGVHMKSFIGRVRTCDTRTHLWRTEAAFGEYSGSGPSTRFVVWHMTDPATGKDTPSLQYVN